MASDVVTAQAAPRSVSSLRLTSTLSLIIDQGRIASVIAKMTFHGNYGGMWWQLPNSSSPM